MSAGGVSMGGGTSPKADSRARARDPLASLLHAISTAATRQWAERHARDGHLDAAVRRAWEGATRPWLLLSLAFLANGAAYRVALRAVETMGCGVQMCLGELAPECVVCADAIRRAVPTMGWRVWW